MSLPPTLLFLASHRHAEPLRISTSDTGGQGWEPAGRGRGAAAPAAGSARLAAAGPAGRGAGAGLPQPAQASRLRGGS